MKSRRSLCRAALTAALALSVAAHAIEKGPVAIHGSLSTTAAWSDTYDFYGDTRNKLDVSVTELILNGTTRFQNGITAGAQIYAYDLAGFKDLTLDWANVAYSFDEKLSLRLGRNKLPQGLHNDAQDLDVIRIFASLPFGFYPRYLRPITASYDGLGLSGTWAVGRAGSFDYQFFAGRTDNIGRDTYFLHYFSGWQSQEVWRIDGLLSGAHLFWNTPVPGLKVGYSHTLYPKNELRGHLAPTSQLTGTDLAFANRFGPAWDRAFAGTPTVTTDMEIVFRTWSAEYTRGNLTLSAEHKKLDIDGRSFVPAFGIAETQRMPVQRLLFAYGSATYQLTDRLGVGTYYSYRDNDYTTRSNPNWRSVSHDYCGAVSFAATRSLLLKAEYHRIDGQNLPADTTRGVALTERYWNYVVLKATFTF
jgi:hypothetical protein